MTLARNALQIGGDDGNALAGAPWGVGDPTDPMVYAGVQNAARVADPLVAWLAAQRAKQDATKPIWNPNNPVGTETTRPQQWMSSPDPSFRPGVFVGGGTVPMSAEQIDSFREGSQNFYDQASLLAGLPGGGPASARVAASRRPLANPPPPSTGVISLQHARPGNLRPLSVDPDLEFPGNHTFLIKNPAGERVGVVDTEWDPNLGNLHIADIQSNEGANSLGAAAIKQIRGALLEQYPDAKTLSGHRITGAAPNRDAFQRLLPYQGREQ